MRVTLEYDTESERFERSEVLIYANAHRLYCSLSEIDQLCRSEIKHNENLSDECRKLLDRIRDLCEDARQIEG